MKLKEVLNKQISLTKFSENELAEIQKETDKFVGLVKKALKKIKAKAEIFIGGSLAKDTLIKKKIQDIDIFLRFEPNYSEEKIAEVIKKLKINYGIKKKIHGSRDYVQFEKGGIVFELVPVLKIKKPEQAHNVTDLSFFHVNYIIKQIKKNKKLADEIKLAKAFCFANECYGAESFIRGFSGYGLELLISYYGGFVSWLKSVIKIKDKLIIDPKKFYKNKQEILFDLNESKLESPIVFVDPTFKQRNALAALSGETFCKFQKKVKSFLAKPSLTAFKRAKIDKKKYNLVLVAKTNKQRGDIAGTKLLKFFRYLNRQLKQFFIVGKSAFSYDDKKSGKYYFKIKEKGREIVGPPVKMREAVLNFKAKHKKTSVKKGRVYAKEKSVSIKQFLRKLDKKIMREMGITNLNQ